MVSAVSRSILLTRARLISAAMIAISPAITAAMSLAFYGEVRMPMLVTSVVCAVVIDRLVQRITRRYRARLRAAHHSLEQRVEERTRELDALRAELMERDRLATAGMVAAGVSHEIRSPLTVIRFALDYLVEIGAEIPPEAAAMLADAGEATSSIEEILRDLTSVARPADEPVVPTDLTAAIDTAVRLASYRLGAGVKLERAPIDVPRVHANGARLVQVFLNLIVNAARATRAGRTNHIRIAAETRGDRVAVSIADTGCGMSDEVKARLFEPFFTTGRESGGTGLGLTICRNMIERMAGTLAIRSQVDVGTTVEVGLHAA